MCLTEVLFSSSPADGPVPHYLDAMRAFTFHTKDPAFTSGRDVDREGYWVISRAWRADGGRAARETDFSVFFSFSVFSVSLRLVVFFSFFFVQIGFYFFYILFFFRFF